MSKITDLVEEQNDRSKTIGGLQERIRIIQAITSPIGIGVVIAANGDTATIIKNIANLIIATGEESDKVAE